MKNALLLLAVTLFAGSVFANEKAVSFYYHNNEAYYACSYAESQMKSVLKTVGAEDISMNCAGGIDNGSLLPLSMNATFTHSEKGERTITLRGRESCDFNVKLVRSVLATIDHEVMDSQVGCSGANGSYKFVIGLK